MRNRTQIAIAVSLTLLLAAGLFLLLYHPRKPAPIRHAPKITDFFAPGATEIVGVGLMLRSGSGGQVVVVVHIVPNSPAAEAGITNGVIINKVDDVSLEGKNLVDCVNLIRGPVGTTVRLELVTPDHSQTNTVELTRKKISL